MERTYYAFISYSRLNTAAASFLHRQLEHFRIPVKYVNEEYLPPGKKLLRPIFRDKRDLEVSANDFTEDIRNALTASRYLIVLCSPEAAESVWVNEEIRCFLETHNHDYDLIVPVILTGKPGHAGNQECLPPALRVEQITCRNLPTMIPDEGDSRKSGWENGGIQALSYMLHVPREKIKASISAEKVRLAQLSSVIGSAVTLLLVGLTIWALRAQSIANVQKMYALENEKLALENEAKAKANEQRAIESKRLADQNANAYREQVERTEKVLFYLQEMFYQADPENGGRTEIKLVDALKHILPKIAAEKSRPLAAELNLHIGIFLLTTNQYKKAEDLLHKAHQFYTENMPGSEYCALAKEKLALFLVAYDFKNAKKYAEEALQIRKQLYGNNSAEIDRLYLMLSDICFRLSQYEEARNYAEQALQNCLRRSDGELNEDVADCFHRISNAYGGLGQSDKELSYLQMALDIRSARLGEQHYKTAQTYNNLGVYHEICGIKCQEEKKQKEAQEHFDTALKNYQKAMKIMYVALGKDHPSVRRVHFNHGRISLLLNDLQTAEKHFEEVIGITQKLFPDKPSFVAKENFNIGTTCLEAEYYPEALKYFNKSLAFFQASDKEKDRIEVKETLFCIARTYENMKDYRQALEIYKETLKLVEELKLPDMEKDRMRFLFRIARTCENMKDHRQALEIYKETLKLVEELKQPDMEKDRMSVLFRIALTCENMGDHRQALEIYRKTLKLVEELKLPDMEEDRKIVLERIQEVEKAMQTPPAGGNGR